MADETKEALSKAEAAGPRASTPLAGLYSAEEDKLLAELSKSPEKKTKGKGKKGRRASQLAAEQAARQSAEEEAKAEAAKAAFRVGLVEVDSKGNVLDAGGSGGAAPAAGAGAGGGDSGAGAAGGGAAAAASPTTTAAAAIPGAIIDVPELPRPTYGGYEFRGGAVEAERLKQEAAEKALQAERKEKRKAEDAAKREREAKQLAALTGRVVIGDVIEDTGPKHAPRPLSAKGKRKAAEAAARAAGAGGGAAMSGLEGKGTDGDGSTDEGGDDDAPPPGKPPGPGGAGAAAAAAPVSAVRVGLLAHMLGERGESLRNVSEEETDVEFQKVQMTRDKVGRRLFAIVIYNDAFADAPNLPAYVSERGLALYNLISDKRFCGYPVENVRKIHNATAEEFDSAFGNIASRAKKDSIVSIIVISRGCRLRRGLHRGSYIMMTDTPWNGEATGAEIAAQAVGYKRLKELCEKFKTKNVTLYLDVCNLAPDDVVMKSVLSGRALAVRPDFPALIHKNCGIHVVAPAQLAVDTAGVMPGEPADFSYDLLGAFTGGGVQKLDELFMSGTEVVKWLQDVMTFRVNAERDRLATLVARGTELKVHGELLRRGKKALKTFIRNKRILDDLMRRDLREVVKRAKARRHLGPVVAYGDMTADDMDIVALRPRYPPKMEQPVMKSKTMHSLTMEWELKPWWGMPIRHFEVQMRGEGRANKEWVTVSTDFRMPYKYQHSFVHIKRHADAFAGLSAYLGALDVPEFPGRRVNKKKLKLKEDPAAKAKGDGEAKEDKPDDWSDSDDESSDDDDDDEDEGEEAVKRRADKAQKKLQKAKLKKQAERDALKAKESAAAAEQAEIDAKARAEKEIKLKPVKLTPPKPIYRVADLVPDAAYQVRVRAMNLGGWGPWSPASEVLYTWKAVRIPLQVRVDNANDAGARALVKLLKAEPLWTELHAKCLKFLASALGEPKERAAFIDEDGFETVLAVMKATPSSAIVQARASFVLALMSDKKQQSGSPPLLMEPQALLSEVRELCTAAMDAFKYDVAIVNYGSMAVRAVSTKLPKPPGARKASISSEKSSALLDKAPTPQSHKLASPSKRER